MAKLFITGDRTMSPIYPGMVFLEVLRAVVRGDELVTGDNEGVEQLVRELGEQVPGLEVSVITSPRTEDGKVDWDTRHTSLQLTDDLRVLCFHVEPMASSVVRSLVNVVPADLFELVTPAELLG